jgi:hypothetical protein
MFSDINDTCYICKDDANTETLRKPCENNKCGASAHSSCLSKQFNITGESSFKCACTHKIIIRKGKFTLVPISRLCNNIFLIIILLINIWLIFTSMLGLNPMYFSTKDLVILKNENGSIIAVNLLMMFLLIAITLIYHSVMFVAEKNTYQVIIYLCINILFILSLQFLGYCTTININYFNITNCTIEGRYNIYYNIANPVLGSITLFVVSVLVTFIIAIAAYCVESVKFIISSFNCTETEFGTDIS